VPQSPVVKCPRQIGCNGFQRKIFIRNRQRLASTPLAVRKLSALEYICARAPSRLSIVVAISVVGSHRQICRQFVRARADQQINILNKKQKKRISLISYFYSLSKSNPRETHFDISVLTNIVVPYTRVKFYFKLFSSD